MIETANRPAATAPDASSRPEQAAWNLLMPAASSVLCFASHVPAWVPELQRRGVVVDVAATAAGAPTRCNDRCYELAVVWEPGSIADLQRGLDAVQCLAPPVPALWVCSRNPMLERGAATHAPAWRDIDAALRRAGWRIRYRHLGLPDGTRPRQIIEWERYPGPGLMRHARSHRWWKAWATRQPLYRWRLPVRGLAATREGPGDTDDTTPPAVPMLSRLLGAVSLAQACEIALQRLSISPNGVAIALVDCNGRDRAGVLKIPFVQAAEPRVRTNARALQWWSQPPAALSGWSSLPPGFLGRGDVGAWSYTLEERVAGTSPQEWKPADAGAAVERLGEFLRAMHTASSESVRLGRASLDALCGSDVRRIQALLDADLAHRLQATLEGAIQTLEGASIPLVPRHGDFKLDNVLGTPRRPSSLRVIDWELWAPRGLPLLDAVHLVVSRARRREGIALGDAIGRWLEHGLAPDDQRWVERVAPGVDPRYERLLPFLYWLDRIGPAAARGAWPSPAWAHVNVERPLVRMAAIAVGAEA